MRWLFVGMAGLALVGICAVAALFLRREPLPASPALAGFLPKPAKPDVRTLRQRWVAELASPSVEGRCCAVDALIEFAVTPESETDAILKLLDADDAQVRKHAVRAVGKLNLAPAVLVKRVGPLLGDDDYGVRPAVVGLLVQAGEPGMALLAQTLLTHGRDEVRRNAAIGVSRAPLPLLVPHADALRTAAWRDPDAQVRFYVQEGLVRLSTASVELVRADLTHREPLIRRAAAFRLAETPDALPALIVLLGDVDADVRAAAAGTLAKRGPAAREAEPALVRALGDANTNVRMSAANAVGEIKIASPAAIAALAKISMTDRDPNARQVAEMALGKLGPAAVEPLIRRLGQPDLTMPQCADALGQIGLPAVAPVRALRTTKDAKVRANVADALGHLYAADPTVLDDLRALATDPDAWVRRCVYFTCANVGPAAIELVRQGMSDPDAEVRVAAGITLNSFDRGAKLAIPELLAQLKDITRSTRERPLQPLSSDVVGLGKQLAILTLGKIGPDAIEVVGPLREASQSVTAALAVLENPQRKLTLDELERQDSLRAYKRMLTAALASIDTPAVGDVDAVVARFQMTPYHDAKPLCETLGMCGPSARAALPRLLLIAGSSTHSDGAVRRAAVIAILQIDADIARAQGLK